jgi:four helix bundle protein
VTGGESVADFRELRAYRLAFEGSMRVFRLTREWPREEMYSLTDQVRRSSRSVCGNIAEGWQKRRYPASFASKLTDACAEAEETCVWLDFALHCGYLPPEEHARLGDDFRHVASMLKKMLQDPGRWTGPRRR